MIDPGQIADARRALGRQLAALRRAAGHNQAGFAPLTGYGRSTIANVETGRQNVPRSFWRGCDELLAADGVLLAGYDRLEALIRHARREAADLERQAEATSGPWAAPAGDAAQAATGSPSARPGDAHSPTGVDLVAVAQLRQTLAEIAQAYDRVPAVSLLAAAARCQAQIAGMRDHAAGGRLRRELLAAEAETAIVMGQLLWDASQRRDHATTLAHFDHAAAAAQAIGDAVAEAHATLRKSYVALYGVRQPQTGLALASQAARLSRAASSTLSGVALLHVAEAHGMLGDRRACENTLDQAQMRLAHRNALDPAADFYSPPHFDRLAGSCYLSLALPAKAQAHLERSAHAMPGRQKVSALVLGNLALAYIQARKLDEATATLHEAIDVVDTTRGGGGLNVVFAAGRKLRPWRDQPQVHAIHDRLLALMA